MLTLTLTLTPNLTLNLTLTLTLTPTKTPTVTLTLIQTLTPNLTLKLNLTLILTSTPTQTITPNLTPSIVKNPFSNSLTPIKVSETEQLLLLVLDLYFDSSNQVVYLVHHWIRLMIFIKMVWVMLRLVMSVVCSHTFRHSIPQHHRYCVGCDGRCGGHHCIHFLQVSNQTGKWYTDCWPWICLSRTSVCRWR